MPLMTDPMDALKAFEPALKSGELAIQRGDIDPEVLFHLDRPNGETRFTYAKLLGETVAALAVIVMSDPLEGKPVFQIGYAVPQHLRKRGLAKDIANAAIAELQNGLARNGIKSFHVEAVVGQRNAASQKVAASVIGGEPREMIDEISGEPAYAYMREINTD